MFSNISFGMTLLKTETSRGTVSKILSPKEESIVLKELKTQLDKNSFQLDKDSFQKTDQDFELKTNPDYKVKVFNSAIKIQHGQETLIIQNPKPSVDSGKRKKIEGVINTGPITSTPNENKRLIKNIIDKFKAIK